MTLHEQQFNDREAKPLTTEQFVFLVKNLILERDAAQESFKMTNRAYVAQDKLIKEMRTTLESAIASYGLLQEHIRKSMDERYGGDIHGTRTEAVGGAVPKPG